MSDIAIRFDGLVLAASLAFGASIFVAIALITAVLGFARRRPTTDIRSDVRRPLLYGLLSATMFGAALLYMENGPTPEGPDWIDWLSVAYLPMLIWGCVAIIRKGR